jgi:hypothetical protein
MESQVQSDNKFLAKQPLPRKGFIGMVANRHFILVLFIFLVLVAGCSFVGEGGMVTPHSTGLAPSATVTMIPSATTANPAADGLATINHPVSTQGSKTPTQTASPTSTFTPTPTETEVVFEAGKEINIKYLRDLEIIGSEITLKEELVDRSNYHQHLVSYFSEGNKIYGLLTMPFVEPPEGGFKAIVFNHGYIHQQLAKQRNVIPPTLITWQGAVLLSLRSITGDTGSRKENRLGRTSRLGIPSTRSPRLRAYR